MLTKGDKVNITYQEQSVDGEVTLASGNGQSLVLSFEAILGGYVGMMAVLGNGDSYCDLITGIPVTIDKVKGDGR